MLGRIAVACLASVSVAAGAEDLLPVVRASIHDEPRNGEGDSFNAPPFEGLIRVQAHREDRAILEYDLYHLRGKRVTSARFTGRISNNNAGGDFPRVFEFVVYHGNGVAELTDYQIPGTVEHTASWPAPSPPLDFTFDATERVADLIASGATHIGLRVQGASMNLFPSILGEATVLSVEVAECLADLNGDGEVDSADFFIYLDWFAAGDPRADINGDGEIDSADFFLYLDLFAQGCS